MLTYAFQLPSIPFLERAMFNSENNSIFHQDVWMNVNSQIMPYAHSTRCSRLILLFISRQSQIQTTYNHLFFHFEHCLYFYFLKTVPLSVNLHVLDLFIVPQPKKSFSFPQSPKGNLFHD